MDLDIVLSTKEESDNKTTESDNEATTINHEIQGCGPEFENLIKKCAEMKIEINKRELQQQLEDDILKVKNS